MAKYFVEPFAVDGDKTVVPDDVQPSGAVSYSQGFTISYTLVYPSDPAALAFPRRQFNQLMNDATTAIQQYQQFGFPEFITEDDNLGDPFPYSKYAMTLYDAGGGIELYQSLEDGNDTLPTDVSKWNKVNNISSAASEQNGIFVYAGDSSVTVNQIQANFTPPVTVLVVGSLLRVRMVRTNTGGSTLSVNGLTAYPIYNSLIGGTTTLTGGEMQAGYTSLFLWDGTSFDLLNPMLPPGSLVPIGTIIDYGGNTLLAGFLDCNGSPVSRTTYAKLFAAIGVLWGAGDGSTTFNVPNLTRHTKVGVGGSATGVLSNTVGSLGGEETHEQTESEIARHAHALGGFWVGAKNDGGGSVGSINVGTAEATVTDTAGSAIPMNIMQPSAVVYMQIKY